jgi:hypothetical protein
VKCIGVALLAGAMLFATGTSLGASERLRSAAASGPVYVPLDNWVYPALKRLASLGYAPDAESLAMPWTRRQCTLLVAEAVDIESRRSTRLSAGKLNALARELIEQLKAEFAGDDERGPNAKIESVYVRGAAITGPALRDSFHFGQTLSNDSGRPYAEGGNSMAGLSAYASAGRFSAYARAEYQQAAATAPYSLDVRQFIGGVDGIPTPSAHSFSVSRVEPLELYAGMALGPFDITIGRQNTWWGPGEASAFHFSNNAPAFDALRISQNMPFLLPGPLRLLGRIRTQFLFGRLAGHEFPPDPWINAQKITLQLTENFEIGFTRSAIFGGAGHPLTTASVLRSFFSTTSSSSGPDAGDRRSGFDFRWYVPKLRRRLTIYSDSLADDDPNPLANPRRAAWAPGLYLTSLPRLSRLDLRFETYSTWLYRKDEGGGFIYWNNQYRDGYTNDGFLIGSWVGRDARAYTASSSYWFSAQNKLTAGWRQTKTGSKFLPGGGTQTDVSLSAQWRFRSRLQANLLLQGERYNIPILGAPRRNFTAQLQLTYFPKNWAIRR